MMTKINERPSEEEGEKLVLLEEEKLTGGLTLNLLWEVFNVPHLCT